MEGFWCFDTWQFLCLLSKADEGAEGFQKAVMRAPGIPRDFKKGTIGTLGIPGIPGDGNDRDPRHSKKGTIGTLGIPRDSKKGIPGDFTKGKTTA